MNNKSVLNKKQELKRIKMILEITNEIKKLENDIKKSKKNNIKATLLRSLMIFFRFQELIAPYVACLGISLGIFHLGGESPFVLNDVKVNLERKKEFDSLGNIRYEEMYDIFDEKGITVDYFGKWEKKDDIFYQREIKKYLLNQIDEDKVMEAINNNDVDLDSLLGVPESVKTEIKNNLTNEEIMSDAYLQAVLYDKTDDFIVIQENIERNVFMGFLCLISSLSLMIIPAYLRGKFSSFDFYACVRQINEKYPNVDKEQLIKKLELTKSNYDRLMR